MYEGIARVYYRGMFAGALIRETGSPQVVFQYDSEYLLEGCPIAYLLPLQEEPFISEGLPPFFDSMVSEGWLKKIQSTTQKISPDNRFELLINNGEDLPGMVSVVKGAAKQTKSQDEL